MTDLLTPVLKVRELPCSTAVAFTLFTDRMGEWWPIETHSVAGDRVQTITVEPVVGGHVYETDDAGVRRDWATVVVHEAPHLLVLDWYAGQTPDDATRVEITITPSGSACRLCLEHTGWTASGVRDNYDSGWDLVLDRLPLTP